MNDITVTIAGPCNSGKSTVAIALRDALEKAGVMVRLEDDDTFTPPDFQPERLKTIKDRTRVDIHIISTRRRS